MTIFFEMLFFPHLTTIFFPKLQFSFSFFWKIARLSKIRIDSIQIIDQCNWSGSFFSKIDLLIFSILRRKQNICPKYLLYISIIGNRKTTCLPCNSSNSFLSLTSPLSSLDNFHKKKWVLWKMANASSQILVDIR